jgi:Cd2+/Zn2+-exporting ATPase
MTEKTIELEIPLLLPGVEAEDDLCLARLETALQDRKGLRRVHLQREKRPVKLCLHYDPDVIPLAQVERLASRVGAQIANRYRHALIPIEGMDCSDCSIVIEHSVGRMDGVMTVSVNYPAETMRVEFDGRVVERRGIEKRLRSLGYVIPVSGVQKRMLDNRELLLSLASGLMLSAGWMVQTFFGFPPAAALAFYIGAYLSGGWNVARHAWQSLRIGRFDTDLLMVTAALGAAILGAWAEGALLLFLFSLGHSLEERALGRARAAIRALADLSPKTALVKRESQEMELPVEQVQLDDAVILRPGVRMPVDGVILSGRGAVDQSPVTGESVPVEKAPGDPVFAGSVNGEAALEVKVTRLAKDSTLARVIKMVEEAQGQRSPTQQTVERFTRVFVPSVMAVTALVIVVPPLLGVPFQVSFMRAMTLLVAASPCALALGTPASILAGVAQAARNGVLVKGGVHLENLGRIRAIAFDKTGTITHGQSEVTDVIQLPGSNSLAKDKDSLLALAAAIESRSAHPLAKAIVRAARIKGLSLPRVAEVESLPGQGLRASVNSRAVMIGSPRLMDQQQVPVPTGAQELEGRLQAAGKTTTLVAVDGQVEGILALADTIRPDALAAIRALRQMGVSKTVILTGDNARVASAIAEQAGVTLVRAELMPEDKVATIRALRDEFGPTAMVGDGVNDAPALAHATVGIAMGGAGTDVALETADVALMGDDLSRLPFAVGLGRATRAIIRQNLAISLGVIALLIVASLTGLSGIGAAILLHEGSTLLVVTNALRLLGYTGGPASPRGA